jgi:hypothetical protein
MTYLTVAGVVAGPRLNIGGTTVYSGQLGLLRNTAFRGAVRPTDSQPFTFFVPESDPYPHAPTKLWLEVSLRRIRTLGNPTVIDFGVHDEQVALAPDPRGGEHQWLQISLQVPLVSVEEVVLNYRVTVQT